MVFFLFLFGFFLFYFMKWIASHVIHDMYGQLNLVIRMKLNRVAHENGRKIIIRSATILRFNNHASSE